MIKASRYMGLVLGSFLAPQTHMIFGDGVGASLVVSSHGECSLVAALLTASSFLRPPLSCHRFQGKVLRDEKEHQR